MQYPYLLSIYYLFFGKYFYHLQYVYDRPRLLPAELPCEPLPGLWRPAAGEHPGAAAADGGGGGQVGRVRGVRCGKIKKMLILGNIRKVGQLFVPSSDELMVVDVCTIALR